MKFLTEEKLTIVGAAGMIGSNMAQTAMMMRLTPNICLYDPFAPALEGVAEDMLLRDARPAVRDHVDIQPQFHRQRIERLARNDLRPQLGHEPLVAVGVFDEEIVRSHGLDHRVAQILQALVVDRTAVLQNQRS